MEIATRSIQLSYPFINGEGGRTRTCNLGFRKPVLVISSEISLFSRDERIRTSGPLSPRQVL